MQVYKLLQKSKKYKILICEKKLNLLDYKKLDKWFKNKPDIVINCAE